mgnify:CR=1 FL=1
MKVCKICNLEKCFNWEIKNENKRRHRTHRENNNDGDSKEIEKNNSNSTKDITENQKNSNLKSKVSK